MIYMYTFIFIAIYSFTDIFVNNKLIKLAPVLILILLAAFRSWNVGIDTIQYVNDYQQINWDFGSIYNFERGFTLIEKSVALIHAPVWVFLMTVATISLVSLFINYSKMTNLSTVAILYYYSRFYFNRDLNQMRSGIASALVLFSIPFLKQKKPIQFILVIILAAQFHSAAYLMLLAYPFSYILEKCKKSGFFIVLSLLVISIGLSFKIQPLLLSFTNLFGEGSAYVTSQIYIEGKGLLNPVMWMQIVLALVASFLYFKTKYKKNIDISVLSIYVLSTIVLTTLNQYAVLGGRLSTVVATVEPIILIYILKSFFKSKNSINALMVLISLAVIIIVYYLSGDIPTHFEPYILFS